MRALVAVLVIGGGVALAVALAGGDSGPSSIDQASAAGSSSDADGSSDGVDGGVDTSDAPVDSRSTAPTGVDDACVELVSGEWSGAWQSDRVDGVLGTVNATVLVDGGSISGDLSLFGNTTDLIDSGTIVGSVSCSDIEISVGNDAVDLVGTVGDGGTSFSGTYSASFGSSEMVDYGSFELST